MNNNKKVFISGIYGQLGSLTADYLLKNTDYDIIGGTYWHDTSINNIIYIKDNPRFQRIDFDLNNYHSICTSISTIKPDYFINFAGKSFVGESWENPLKFMDVATSTINILENIKTHCPNCRFFNAGSSEEFANVKYSPQDENHPLSPKNPYGVNKATQRLIINSYRDQYNLYVVHGIIYNSESYRRSDKFISRKITKGVAKIKKSLLTNTPFDSLSVGNINSSRDWSDAEDIVEGIWKMLNQETPNNYVLSSDKSHTVKEFIELAFKYANINGVWHGHGENEEFSITTSDAKKYSPYNSVLVKINPKFYRPIENKPLVGYSKLARKELNWVPKTSFEDLIQKMIFYDLNN